VAGFRPAQRMKSKFRIFSFVQRGQAYSSWVLLALVIFFIEFPYFKIPFSANEGIFSCVAQEMRYGAKLYLDVWDHKPPLLYLHFIFLQDLFGTSELPLRLYTALFHWIDAFLLFLLALKLGCDRRTAWMTSWVYVFLLLPPFFQAWTPQAEVLMQPFLLASFCLVLVGKNWSNGLSGVLWAISFFTKPTSVFFTPLYFLLVRKEKIKSALFFVLGLDIAATVIVLPFLLDGRFPLLSQAIWGFNRVYSEWGWQTFFTQSDYRQAIGQWHLKMLLIYGVPILITLGFLSRDVTDKSKKVLNTALFILGWFLIAVITCLISGFFLTYYYFMLVPPLALGLGMFFNRIWGRKYLFGGLAGLMFLCLMIPWERVWLKGADGIENSEYSVKRSQEAKDMGLYLKSISKPDDRLFVWSIEPQIYVYSGLKMTGLRTPLVNHLVKMPQEWSGLEGLFEARLPDYVVISNFDQLIPTPPWFPDVLKRDYLKKNSLGHYDLFSRKTGQ
jgi:hypothetical protein